MKHIMKIKYNLLYALLFSIFVFIPDIVLELFLPSYDVNTDVVFVFAMFAFGFFLSLNRNFYAFIFIMMLLLFLIGFQVAHVGYFGVPISPTDVHKIFVETGDIVTSSIGNIIELWFVPVGIFLPIILMIYAYTKIDKKMQKMPFAFLIVLCFFIPKIERSFRKEIKHFLPSPVRYVMHNSINTFSFYVAKEAWNENKVLIDDGFYADYVAVKNNEKTDNIVVVMGESINPNAMGLYGAKRSTTPFLSSLKNNPKFFYSLALSSGVSTHTGLAFFLNVVREPGNIAEFKSKTVNLFRLAKEAGYATYYISAQDSKGAYDIGAKYVDKIITVESERTKFLQKGDFALVDMYKDVPINEKSFVFIQTRTAHDPFGDNYEKSGKYDVYSDGIKKRDEYDNSILAFDDFLSQLFGAFLDVNKDKKSFFVVTSDHGQSLGDNGRWGHNILGFNIAEVPFFFYQTKGKVDVDFDGLVSHYEIGEFVASQLGYDIKNANMETNKTFFIHGNNYLSNYEFIEYEIEKKSPKQIRREFLLDYIGK